MNQDERKILFDEMTLHLVTDEVPSEYITSLSEEKDLQEYPYTMLWRLKATKQSPKYHPEGSVWNHSMLVLDEAAKVREKVRDKRAFMWAALLHDIGKYDTTRIKKDKITSYDHDKAGEKLCYDFLSNMTDDEAFINKVSSLVRYHMHMLYVLKGLPYADMPGLFQKVNIDEIALLCRCDRLGRTGADSDAEDAEYKEFRSKLQYMVLKH